MVVWVLVVVLTYVQSYARSGGALVRVYTPLPNHESVEHRHARHERGSGGPAGAGYVAVFPLCADYIPRFCDSLVRTECRLACLTSSSA